MQAKDFEKIIISSTNNQGTTLEIHYVDGTIVEGFVQKVSYSHNPPYVILCKSVTPWGQSSDHQVLFDRIVKVIVKPYGDSPIVYE